MKILFYISLLSTSLFIGNVAVSCSHPTTGINLGAINNVTLWGYGKIHAWQSSYENPLNGNDEEGNPYTAYEEVKGINSVQNLFGKENEPHDRTLNTRFKPCDTDDRDAASLTWTISTDEDDNTYFGMDICSITHVAKNYNKGLGSDNDANLTISISNTYNDSTHDSKVYICSWENGTENTETKTLVGNNIVWYNNINQPENIPLKVYVYIK